MPPPAAARRPRRGREAGAGAAGNVDIALRVHLDAVGAIVVRPSQQGRPQELAVGGELGYERVAFPECPGLLAADVEGPVVRPGRGWEVPRSRASDDVHVSLVIGEYVPDVLSVASAKVRGERQPVGRRPSVLFTTGRQSGQRHRQNDGETQPSRSSASHSSGPPVVCALSLGRGAEGAAQWTSMDSLRPSAYLVTLPLTARSSITFFSR